MMHTVLNSARQYRCLRYLVNWAIIGYLQCELINVNVLPQQVVDHEKSLIGPTASP